MLADVERVDALITDAPHSERTHKGHNAATRGYDEERRSIDYDPWTPSDVHAFVRAWHPRTRGWFITITDHVLKPHWAQAFRDTGRYVFDFPIPLVEIASRVRRRGDGPACWTCEIVMARPRTPEFSGWGARRGAYIATRDPYKGRMGGKSLKSMRELVTDYTRPGWLVCDPCAGEATIPMAAVIENRRTVASEMDPGIHAGVADLFSTDEGLA